MGGIIRNSFSLFSSFSCGLCPLLDAVFKQISFVYVGWFCTGSFLEEFLSEVVFVSYGFGGWPL